MSRTIGTDNSVSTACAVFKIDLRGRFVYIDDETEELLGLTREELFGKSIYEFISSDSHQVLDIILGNHKRYESFYESLSLTMREGGGRLRRLDTVITLNFIAGNPVNYQFILLPPADARIMPGVNWERHLLETTRLNPEEIDFSQIAEMFCALGGYPSGECYLGSNAGDLESVGSFPHQDPDHSAPTYLERFLDSKKSGFSFIPEDCRLHEGFGKGKSEAVLALPFHNQMTLFVWLYGPAEYRPPETRLREIRLFTETWEASIQPGHNVLSTGYQFKLLGQAADALELGLLVVNDSQEMIFRNNGFSKIIGSSEDVTAENDFRELYRQLDPCDLEAQPLPYSKSPFAQSVEACKFIVGCLRMVGHENPMTVLTGPIGIGEEPLFVFCFIPYNGNSSEALLKNHSGVKLIRAIAHDIRAPLITIEAFTNRLQANHADQLDKDGRFAVNCVMENGRILQQMVQALGDMSQNWEDQEVPEKVYARMIINDQITYLKATYPNTQYQIKIPNGLPEIYAPKRKLMQLFRNILDNAFKYSASADKPMVTIEYSLENGWHQFSVSDNGPGVEKQYREKIFSPFFRIPDAMSLPGTGMGLAIASDIVSSWGGKIWLDNPHKRGSKISFILPSRMKG
jgi:PAS domain S-box-containing protein